MIPLAIKKVCEDCGAVLKYVEELDTHDLHCLGPITLRFIDEGDPVAEPGSE
jgi:hypothetical protein